MFFNVGFRNGPEVKCPTNQQDFVDAFLHIYQNASRFGIDTEKIAIGGVSGGGWISTGAANLMVKSGDIGKVNSLHVYAGMLSDQTGRIPKAQLLPHENSIYNPAELRTGTYKLLATNFEE